MSQSQVHVRYTRGGREFSNSSFSLDEVRQTPFQNHLPNGFTAGLGNQFDSMCGAKRQSMRFLPTLDGASNLESLLRRVSTDGEIEGKTFVIDCTAEHRGAHER